MIIQDSLKQFWDKQSDVFARAKLDCDKIFEDYEGDAGEVDWRQNTKMPQQRLPNGKL